MKRKLTHNPYLTLTSHSYTQQEEEVLSRIKASVDSPLALEEAGFALFDLYPERRGNLFSDEVSILLLFASLLDMKEKNVA